MRRQHFSFETMTLVCFYCCFCPDLISWCRKRKQPKTSFNFPFFLLSLLTLVWGPFDFEPAPNIEERPVDVSSTEASVLPPSSYVLQLSHLMLLPALRRNRCPRSPLSFRRFFRCWKSPYQSFVANVFEMVSTSGSLLERA